MQDAKFRLQLLLAGQPRSCRPLVAASSSGRPVDQSTLVIDALSRSARLRTSGRSSPTVDSTGATSAIRERVTMRPIMKDVGTAPDPGQQLSPSPLSRDVPPSDGRNPGVDVPYPFDSALTFTVVPGSIVRQCSSWFAIPRSWRRRWRPLRPEHRTHLDYRIRDLLVTTRRATTFDATGTIGVEFGNFADPE